MTILRNTRTAKGVVDVLIEDGRIAAIVPAGSGAGASDPGASDLSASDLDSVDHGLIDLDLDLDGRWLLPGLWDNHVHLSQQALALRRVDVAAAGSAAEAARTMAEHLATTRLTSGQPLVGQGFRDGLWPDVPTAALLDSAVSAVPVVLISGDLHCCWLNSAALEKFGQAGHPTGLLREDDCFAVVAALQDVPEATLDEWVAEAGAAAAARGVVGVTDFEMAENLAQWQRRMAAGFDALRIEAGVYAQHLDVVIAAGQRTGEVISGTGGLLRLGPFKVLTDGSLNTRTAYCVDAYPGSEGRGILTVPPDELLPLLRRASAAGILPAVHAIGDEANRLALDAFETAGCRGRIEHAQLLRTDDLARFAALGVAASMQPEHAMDDRDVAELYWAGRTGRSFPLRSLLDAGAQLLLGSDAPVAPLDPWVAMSAAVFRARDGREPWHPEQSITFGEALAASTRSRVAVGEPADLVAVDEDPRSASAPELRSLPVALTLLAGRPTHSAL